MSQQRPATKTPVTAQQMFDALCYAHARYFHSVPSVESLFILVAQWALETGWGKNMHNYNIGNVKARPFGETDWTFFECWEVVSESDAQRFRNDARCRVTDGPEPGKKIVWFSPNHPACCFRSFPELAEGADFYLDTLVSKFSGETDDTNAWKWVAKGDPVKFVHALKLKKYFTGVESVYTQSVVSIANHLSHMGLSMECLEKAESFIPPKSDDTMAIIHPPLFDNEEFPEPEETKPDLGSAPPSTEPEN